MLARVLVLAVFAMGYNLAFGYTGLLSLGHALLLAAGMYAAGLPAHLWGIGAGPAFIAGIAGGGLMAAALGLLFLVYILGANADTGLLFAYVSPWHWKSGLFHPAVATRLRSVAACLGLCVGYTALGYLRFRNRDL